jgi:hypothetical protein
LVAAMIEFWDVLNWASSIVNYRPALDWLQHYHLPALPSRQGCLLMQ